MKTTFAVLFTLILTAASATAGDSPFHTVPLKRATLPATVRATGSLEPEEMAEVGAQVAGRIDRFGADPNNPNRPINFNSVVKQGTVLAYLDATAFEAEVLKAKANLQRAEAELRLMLARGNQAEKELLRVKAREAAKTATKADVEAALAALEVVAAEVRVAEATVMQQKAALVRAELNLSHTVIRSPVAGTILERRANLGQQVGASGNAPGLFLIASDLRRLQVWVTVPEQDVRAAAGGKTVTFTVAPYPDRTFKGRVADNQPRLNARFDKDKGVTVFTVVVEVDNADGALLPFLTAQVSFQGEIKGALVVPNTALRWRPQPQQVVEKYRPALPLLINPKRPVVWVVDRSGLVRPLVVKTGLTNGTVTEVVGGDLTEGTEVVVGTGPEPKGKN